MRTALKLANLGQGVGSFSPLQSNLMSYVMSMNRYFDSSVQAASLAFGIRFAVLSGSL